MSAELGLIAGLGIIAYVLIEIAEEVEDSESQINQGIFTLSLFFMIGLEYTAYGIAQSQGFGNAEIAYLVALLITSISFLGLLAQLVQGVLQKTNDKSALESL
jgi:uncharacterized membrane protein YhdT